MMFFLIFIGTIIVGFALITFIRKHSQQKRAVHPEEEQPQKGSDCASSSCGISCLCDDEELKRSIQTKIVYFEDEELDTYKGIEADKYTEKEIEEFNDVLTTLRPKEVADWLHSLELRGIALPEELKDEAYMLLER